MALTAEIAKLTAYGVVPVVAIEDARHAVPLGEALVAAGLPCIEVTLRTEAALDAIRLLAKAELPICLAAGTVLTREQADAATGAGASIVVAPGFNPTVVDHCLARGLPVVPGVATPSEVEQGLARGLKTLKLFPAEVLGGVAYLRALAGPYQNVRFMPTGGVGPGNLADYLALGNVAAVGGTWLARADALRAGDFASIESLAAAAREIAERHGRTAGTPAAEGAAS